MKKLLFSTLLLLVTITLSYGQSPFGIMNSHSIDYESFYILDGNDDIFINRVSPNNAWIGSKLQYGFNGNESLADNFLFNMTTLYSLPVKGKLQLPLIGNVGLPLSGNQSNVNVGLFPWYLVYNSATLSLVAHGGAEYELYPGEELYNSIQYFSLSAGLELGFWMQSGLPLTLSATPIYSFRNLDLNNLFSLELTGIIPIANGMGILIDSVLGKKVVMGAGLIVNNPIK